VTSLTRMATVELREVIRKDPARRAEAWAELRFRTQANQAFSRENGRHPLPQHFVPITDLLPGLSEA
jgi:hypothetical protein